MIECIERADYLMGNLMGVKAGEEVLIVIDPQTDMRMANAIAGAVSRLGAEYGIYMMPIRGKDKAAILEIPPPRLGTLQPLLKRQAPSLFFERLVGCLSCFYSIFRWIENRLSFPFEKIFSSGDKIRPVFILRSVFFLVLPKLPRPFPVYSAHQFF